LAFYLIISQRYIRNKAILDKKTTSKILKSGNLFLTKKCGQDILKAKRACNYCIKEIQLSIRFFS
jgi:hypothetical protein